MSALLLILIIAAGLGLVHYIHSESLQDKEAVEKEPDPSLKIKGKIKKGTILITKRLALTRPILILSHTWNSKCQSFSR